MTGARVKPQMGLSAIVVNIINKLNNLYEDNLYKMSRLRAFANRWPVDVVFDWMDTQKTLAKAQRHRSAIYVAVLLPRISR